MGHWRVIGRSVAGSMTVTGDTSGDQVRAVRSFEADGNDDGNDGNQ